MVIDMFTQEQLEAMAALLANQGLTSDSKVRRGTKTTAKVKVAAVAAGDVLTAPVKQGKAALEAPKDAERVEYEDKVIAVYKTRKDFGGDLADYITFGGFKARFGDFSLTMKQARLLADPAVYEAFQAYMAKLPE